MAARPMAALRSKTGRAATPPHLHGSQVDTCIDAVQPRAVDASRGLRSGQTGRSLSQQLLLLHHKPVT